MWTDARNVLLDAALEFGANWRRDVARLASERCPALHDDERVALAREITDARAAIERWVLERSEAVHGRWARHRAPSIRPGG